MKGLRYQPNIVWIAVSSDEYELPIAIADKAWELAAIMRTTTSIVRSYDVKYRKGEIKKARFLRVEVDEDDSLS